MARRAPTKAASVISLARFAAAPGYCASTLTASSLRDIRVRAEMGLPVGDGELARIANVLEDLVCAVDEAAKDLSTQVSTWDLEAYGSTFVQAVGEHVELDKEAARDAEESLREAGEALEKEKDHRLEQEREFEAKVEELEAQLAEARSGASGRHDALAEQLRDAEGRYRAAEARASAAEKERDRVEAMVERGAAFWQEKAREEHAVAVAEARGQRDAEARERRRLYEALDGIARGGPEDAHRMARVALGREVLEASGATAREAYSKAPMRRRKPAPSSGT